MSVFTDNDLMRLKVHLKADKEFQENATWVEHVQMDALLARLEAAEKLIGTPDPENMVFHSLYVDWCVKSGRTTASYLNTEERKAAGRP